MILILYTNLGPLFRLQCAVCQWEYILSVHKAVLLTDIAVIFSTHTGSYISPFAKNTIEATIVWYTNMAAFFLCVMTSQISVCTAIVTYTEEVFGPATSIFFPFAMKLLSPCIPIWQHFSCFLLKR